MVISFSFLQFWSLLTVKVIIIAIILIIAITIITNKITKDEDKTAAIGCYPSIVVGIFIIASLFWFDDTRYIVRDDNIYDCDDMLDDNQETFKDVSANVSKLHLRKDCPIVVCASKVDTAIEMDGFLRGRFGECDICHQIIKTKKLAKDKRRLINEIKESMHALASEMAELQQILDTLNNGADLEYCKYLYYDWYYENYEE